MNILISAKNRKRIAIGVILFAVTAPPSFAIFGLGDIVFDPSNFGQLISQGSTLLSQLETAEKHLETAQQHLQTAQNTFNTIEANVQRYTGKNAWRNAITLLKNVTIQNRHGETTGWEQAMNDDDTTEATQAWQNATVGVSGSATAGLSGETPGTSKQLAQLAMIEASDAISPTCINAVAQYRQNRTNGASAQQSLEDDQFDESDDTNSEIEQLNMSNAAQTQNMHEIQAQGALHACIAQQMTVASMQQRNAAAQELNFWATVRQQRTTNPADNIASTDTYTSFLP